MASLHDNHQTGDIAGRLSFRLLLAALHLSLHLALLQTLVGPPHATSLKVHQGDHSLFKIYWNPDNKLFDFKPSKVLNVEENDRVQFLCSGGERHSIYWTLNRSEFVRCNPTAAHVLLLFECPSTPRSSSSAKAVASPPEMNRAAPPQTFFLWIRRERRLHSGSGPYFEIDTPVYFFAERNACKQYNMRLVIVHKSSQPFLWDLIQSGNNSSKSKKRKLAPSPPPTRNKRELSFFGGESRSRLERTILCAVSCAFCQLTRVLWR